MGHLLSSPSKAKIEAVTNARRPETAYEVRNFIGLLNFCAKFIPNFSTVSELLRRLIRKDEPFVWSKEQEQSFCQLKESLINAETLGYFNKDALTRVVTDASPVGLGAVLVQQQNGEDRIISYASRSLTEVERRYSQTEKEALSIVWACERFHMYLFGKEFELWTDHKPLETIYSKKSNLSARISRWVLRLQPYTYKVKYIPGKENIADVLSRLSANSVPEQYIPETEDYVRFVTCNATPRAMTTREIEEECGVDEELSNLRKCIRLNQWQELTNKRFLLVRNELSVIGKLVLRGTRIIVPQSLRERVLTIAHEGHPRIVCMKRRLRTKVWWPNIDRETESFCKLCKSCQIVGNPQAPEPMKPTELPSGPWQQLGADLLTPSLPSGDHLFVVVDYYSRYVEVEFMKSTTTDKIIASLKKMFLTHGLPVRIRTDNGPQFRSEEFKNFLKEQEIQHCKTTPLWPQANGEVERQNRSLLKRMQISQIEGRDWKEELADYLMMYRTTPHSTTGVSPAELMFKRKLHTRLGIEEHDTDDLEQRDRDNEKKEKGKLYTDEKRKACQSDIKPGDSVLLKQKSVNK